MRKRYTVGSIAAVGLVFVLACITVNIYFPEATVKQAAEQIVDEIRKKDAEKSGQEAVKKLASLPDPAPFSFVPAAYAQEATSVSTPAIRALKEAMKNRFPTLKPYFDGGNDLSHAALTSLVSVLLMGSGREARSGSSNQQRILMHSAGENEFPKRTRASASPCGRLTLLPSIWAMSR